MPETDTYNCECGLIWRIDRSPSQPCWRTKKGKRCRIANVKKIKSRVKGTSKQNFYCSKCNEWIGMRVYVVKRTPIKTKKRTPVK